jgi:hypothetical protein
LLTNRAPKGSDEAVSHTSQLRVQHGRPDDLRNRNIEVAVAVHQTVGRSLL